MLRIIFSTLVVILLSMPLMAQEEKPIKIKEVIVSATRYEEPLTSVPANTSIITEEDIKNSTAQNVPDLLRTEAGLHVNDIAGNKRSMTVDIRGFGETAPLNTLVLVDGRPVNQADLSGTDWTLIPLDRIEKIEVVRGGRGSVMYGDNAAGGVINIITQEGDALGAGAAAVVGSYDTYKGNMHFSNSTEHVNYSFHGSYLSSDGYRDNSDTEAKDIGATVHLYPNDTVRIRFSTGYHKDNTGLPGALKDSDFAAGASRIDTVQPRDFAEVEDYYFEGGPEIYFLEDSFIKLNASFRKRSSLSFASFFGGTFLGDTDIKTLTLSPQLLLKHKREDLGNTLTIGFDYQNAKEDILNNSSFSGKAQVDLEKKNHGYYIHDELSPREGLIFSAGYRFNKAEFMFDPASPDETSMDEDLYTAGASYHFYNESYAYLSYSRSFRYPVLDEQFNFFTNTVDASLTAQRAHNYEIGVRHYFDDNDYVHINLFRIDTNDEILFDPNSGLFGTNVNLDGKTRRDGIETSFFIEPCRWMSMSGSYTYMDASIRGGQYEESDIPNVPHHKATLGTVISVGKGFSVALNGIYMGKRPFVSDFTNSFEDQDDYVVVNSKITYTWKNLTAFVDVNNLADKEYSEYGVLFFGFPTEKAFFPSPEFNMLFGISVEI